MTKKLFAAVAMSVVACSTMVLAADKKKPIQADNYAELFAKYLESARRQSVVIAPDPGSWMNSLMSDQRARHVNDLITIRVIESISASGSADSAVTKSGSASAAVPSLFGLEKKLPASIDPTNLASLKTDTAFKGAGNTNRAQDLTATITARVSEVLPNGDLVVEGVRAIEINGDRQIVVLTGVARTADVGPSNIVLSTSLGQLQIKYFGNGLIKDSLAPGFLVRMLNKIF
jgi:flagellar L-ring protein precursor FlgH